MTPQLVVRNNLESNYGRSIIGSEILSAQAIVPQLISVLDAENLRDRTVPNVPGRTLASATINDGTTSSGISVVLVVLTGIVVGILAYILYRKRLAAVGQQI